MPILDATYLWLAKPRGSNMVYALEVNNDNVVRCAIEGTPGMMFGHFRERLLANGGQLTNLGLLEFRGRYLLPNVTTASANSVTP